MKGKPNFDKFHDKGVLPRRIKSQRTRLRYTDEDDFYKEPKNFMCHNVVIAPSNPTAPGLVQGGLARVKIRRTSMLLSDGSQNGYGVWEAELIPLDRTAEGRLCYFCGFENDKPIAAFLSDKEDLLLTPAMTGCLFAVGSIVEKGKLRVTHINNIDLAKGEIQEREKKEKSPLSDKEKQKIREDTRAHQLDSQWRKEKQKEIQESVADRVYSRKGDENYSLIKPEDYASNSDPKRTTKYEKTALAAKNLDTKNIFSEITVTTFGVRKTLDSEVSTRWMFYTQRYEKQFSDTGARVNRMKLNGVYKHVVGPIMVLNPTEKEMVEYMKEEDNWEIDEGSSSRKPG